MTYCVLTWMISGVTFSVWRDALAPGCQEWLHRGHEIATTARSLYRGKSKCEYLVCIRTCSSSVQSSMPHVCACVVLNCEGF